MKLRGFIALLLLLLSAPALAQVQPGASPLSGAKGGTNNAFMQFSGPASALKTYTLPNVSGTLAMLSQVQTWTGAQSFSDGTLVLLGSGSGSSTLKAPATGGGTATLFQGTDTVAGLAAAQTMTNKVFNCASNTCTVRIASDVSGLGTGVATLLGGASSGTGGPVGSTSPTITTPAIAGGALSGTFSGTPTFSGANFLTLANLPQSTAGAQFLGVSGSSAANYAPFTLGSLSNLAAPHATLDLLPIVDHLTGTIKNVSPSSLGAAGAVSSVNSQGGAIVLWPFPQGRLTLTSGTPVMATSVAGATTVYYTGYSGKNVPIYNGTAVAVYQLCAANTVGACELSVTLGSNWGANQNYDWFVALNGGSPALCTGPAWTSDTTRGSGAGTTQLAQLDGLNTNAVSLPNCRINNTTTISVAANQGTYVGSMRTGSAGQTNFIYGASAAGGTAGSFGIWNAYNRITIRTTVNDSNVSWNYTSATVRPADNSTTNRVSFLSGLSESGFTWTYATTITFPAAAANAFFQIGGGFDSTTTFDRNGTALNATTTGMHLPILVKNDYNPTIGWHFVQALEGGDGTNANTSGGTTQQAFTFEFEM